MARIRKNDDASVAQVEPVEAGTRVPRRRASPRKKPPEITGFSVETIRTLDERLKSLPTMRSLNSSPSRPVITDGHVADSVPPSPPRPQEPLPAGFVDRGAPIPEHYGMDRL